jgi:hypothetical protein
MIIQVLNSYINSQNIQVPNISLHKKQNAVFRKMLQARPFLRWVHTCNVTAYRNTVLWQCGWDSSPRNIPKSGYAVTLRACSMRCRYLAITSQGWYWFVLSRSGCAMWHVTSVRSSHLLYIHDASGSDGWGSFHFKWLFLHPLILLLVFHSFMILTLQTKSTLFRTIQAIALSV